MNTLEALINKKAKHSSLWLERIVSNEANENKFSGNFHYYHLLLGINSVIHGDFLAAKANFNICASIDVFQVNKYNSRQLDYSNNIFFSILSDNEGLIERYSKLSYQKGRNAELGMIEMVARGESAIWCNTIQMFMASDLEGVERNLKIIETKTLPKLPKNQQELKIDFEFYKALLLKDKLRCEELLNELISPKIHKKRNDNSVLNQYISMPALGYAKLAWRLGIEVEVDSPLVPKELLPIKPLENYEIPYDFLNE